MAGIDNGRIGKRSELRAKALAHFAFAAAFEVNAARRTAEQRVTREENAGLAVESFQVQADAALGVARGKQDLELEGAELDGLSVL